MKRWIRASADSDHAYHIRMFNENYSKNDPHRTVKQGNIYFTDSYPVSRLIKSYNRKHKDANLNLKTVLVDDKNAEGSGYAYFQVV